MIVLALSLALAAFVAVLRLTGVVAVASEAAAAARAAARALRDPALSDAAKETLSRRAAGRLFGSFLRIAAIGALASGIAFGIVWLGAASGRYDLAAAMATAAGWPFLLGATLVATIGWVAADRLARRRA